MLHTPLLQEGVPLAEEQAWPQAPQLLKLSVMLFSQPSAAFRLQLAHPVLQAMLHTPLVQDGVPLIELQTFPQVPQLLAAFVRLVSQPLAAFPSQLPQPEVQEDMTQILFWHAGIELEKEQTVPQAPQLVTLLEKSRQAPLQLGVNSPVHVPNPLPSGVQVRMPPLQSPWFKVSGGPV
jgi:hypothetical protein